MTWVKIDDGFCRNPKIYGLSDSAFRFHVTALCYCAAHLTDGIIHTHVIPLLKNESGSKRSAAQELVNKGVWKEHPYGYEIHQYLDYNPSKADLEAMRESNARRQREWRERNAVTNTVTSRVSNSAPSRPVPKEHRRPVEKPDTVKGSWCQTCNTRLAPGVYLEDHQRITHAA